MSRTSKEIPRGWRRLLSPGIGSVLAGLILALACIAGLVLGRPAGPTDAWAEGVLSLVLSLATWGGALLGTGIGLGAVLNGFLWLARADRAETDEAFAVRESPDRTPGRAERITARVFVALSALAGATGLVVGTALSDRSEGALTLYVIAGLLGGIALVAGALAVLARNTPWKGQALDKPLARFHRPVPHLHLGILLALVLVAVALQLTLVRWVVEDAAISFAYAEHMAAGEGPVTYPGGEPVEGYSNPLWTFLLAAFYLIGVDGFTSNKILAAVFGAATVPLTWAITREARPHRTDAVPLLAAAVLAGSAQFAIWGAGGLENSLLNVLLALAIWRTLVEGRSGGIPWSAVAWLGVALTRPEGILYAAIGGFCAMVYRIALSLPRVQEAMDRGEGVGKAVWSGIWPTLAWLALFFGPFALYQWWRFETFGWEFPNTYYAKKGNPSKAFEPYRWTRKGWKYLRRWSHELWQGYLLPIYALGLLGRRGIRAAALLVVLVALAVVLLVPGPEWLDKASWWPVDEPRWWVPVRVWTLAAVVGIAPLFAFGRPGWKGLVLPAWVASAALFFSVYAGGDWMNGFRWMATFTVPGAVLFAVGMGEAGDLLRDLADRFSPVPGIVLAALLGLVALVFGILLAIPPTNHITWLGYKGRDPDVFVVFGAVVALSTAVALGLRAARKRDARVRWGPAGWTAALLLLSVVTLPAAHHLDAFLAKPTTSPWKVKKRVDYMNWVQSRLHIEGRPTSLDVDMGANMVWSNDEIVDIAGLVDASMGHHWFDRPFVREYIFEERKPDFAHVHGGWARTSRLTSFSEWKEQYLEIPPYPTSRRGTHGGNHVHRSHLVAEAWHGTPGRRVPFHQEVVLEGWDVPAQGVIGGHLYVEIGWSTRRPREDFETFRTVVFLHRNGVVHSWDTPPGYDWYTPEAWEPGEVVFGRYSVPVPEDLEPGTWDLGVAVLDAEGLPIPAGLEPVDADPPEGDDSPVEAGDTDEPEKLALVPRLKALRSVEVRPAPEMPADVSLDGAVFVRGEVRWSGAVELLDQPEAEARSQADLEQVRTLATEGACQEAEARWLLARRRLTRTWFDEANGPAVGSALAACWAREAGFRTETDARVEAMVRARDWDHRAPEVREVGVPLADELQAAGEAARARYDWEAAYVAFRDALRVDPSRGPVRRLAEEARDCKLKIRVDEHDCGSVQDLSDAAGDEG